ncbi:hypothetical protein ACTQ4E_09600 [Lawsonibacter sp. LCP25S3_G6]|uniref:hypothetical protein n=1 Tax=unclassified Lawsonibacter TaxID=2617946 RepID=UPI003F997E92
MIGVISRKLHSQRGASMLLALLFLLICSMVTASILMAAVANAGKHRSNLEEHQVYLSLSSAVSTLCDELNRCEYRGQYYSWKYTERTGTDEMGRPIYTTYYCFQQDTGSYTYREDPTPALGVPFHRILLSDFDTIFRQEAERKLRESFPDVINKTDPSLFRDSDFDYAMTLSPDTRIAALDGRTVYVTLKVQESYAIYITAYLEGLPQYKVEAELTPNDNKPSFSTLQYAGESEDKIEQTAPMQWTLGWITILDEEEGGGA